jgi:hypothetical protein
MKGHRGGHATVSGFPRTHATYPSHLRSVPFHGWSYCDDQT